MTLDRKLIKSQAKNIINNRVWKIFCVTLIAMIFVIVSEVASSLSSVNSISNAVDDYSYYYGDSSDFYGDDYDNYDFDDYYNDQYGDGSSDGAGSDFYNFGQSYSENSEAQISPTSTALTDVSATTMSVTSILSGILQIVYIIMLPLSVSLAFYYVQLVHGADFSFTDGVKFVYGNTFKKGYGKKLLLVVLRTLFTSLWSLLFIFPGVIYYYKSYFAYQILAENPEMSAMDALKASTKMTADHKSELFVMELSYIPWFFLCLFIFPLIYVMPYFFTTQALYYENFKIRAFQEGRVSEFDFLSRAEKDRRTTERYANPYGYQNQGYQGYQGGYNQYGNYNQYGGYGQNYYNPNQNYNGYNQNDYNNQNGYNYNQGYQNGGYQQNNQYYNPTGQNTYDEQNTAQQGSTSGYYNDSNAGENQNGTNPDSYSNDDYNNDGFNDDQNNF